MRQGIGAIVIIGLFGSYFCINTLVAQSIYWVQFTDKNNSDYSIHRPSEFLSERAVARRERQGIAITEQDLPVNTAYLDSLRKIGFEIRHASKWFNGAIAAVSMNIDVSQAEAFPFVSSLPTLLKPGGLNKQSSKYSNKLDICSGSAAHDYGASLNQIKMLGGDILHNAGFRGEGMLIAVLDAGFQNVNHISSLQTVWDNNLVIAIRDYVSDSLPNFYSHSHGTLVFSIIAGKEEGSLIGSAPNANYILVRTEDGNSEYIVEEYYWVCGAEFADSLGADVINSSLGYSLFDDSTQNHSYSDMNGSTAPISRAADIAASKGMLVVTSAGNSGNNPWYYITAPADAHGVIAVGATDSVGNAAVFSSHGPSADGRVKPDVSAKGFHTVAQYPTTDFINCDGTSCSSPVVAGLAACFWQANPQLTSFEVAEKIRQGSSLYHNPDNDLGNGIPNFVKSGVLLTKDSTKVNTSQTQAVLYPVPVIDKLTLYLLDDFPWKAQQIQIEIRDTQGKLVLNSNHIVYGTVNYIQINRIENLRTGYYSLSAKIKNQIYSAQFLKL